MEGGQNGVRHGGDVSIGSSFWFAQMQTFGRRCRRPGALLEI
jgi:hypothetical protein